MTGYERTIAAINGDPVDRPPFDFWAEDATINKLFEHLGHHDLELFLDEMKIDIRGINATEPSPEHLGDGVYQNMWGERFVYQPTPWGDMREDTYGALYKADSIKEIKAFSWPDNDVMDYSLVYGQCRALREKELAVRYGFADIWQRPALVRGLENHLADMALKPDNVHFLSRKFTDFYLEDYRRAWEASKGNIDIFLVISDLGSQRGPMISVDMFRTFVAPYLTEMADEIHRFGAKVMFHSCGDISSFIPSIIDCGVDILDPIQPVSTDMSPKELKKYSGKICFHGGLDIQWLLPYGSCEDLKKELTLYSALLGPGYIASSAHLFQPDTPVENIIAFYNAF